MKKLNEKQKQVISELDRNVLLIASAGTGKTDVIAERIIKIINDKRAVDNEVLCLTFTNRACKELKERVLSKVGEDGKDITIKTFHSFCYHIIKCESKNYTDVPSDFLVIDEEDGKEIVKELIADKSNSSKFYNFICLIKEKDLEFEFFDYNKTIQFIINNYPHLITEKCFKKKDCSDKELLKKLYHKGGKLVEIYDHFLIERHLLDFNDLIKNAVILLYDNDICNRWANKFKYIFIDEVQDTSIVEYKIIASIFNNSNTMLCGDIFQTIYEWRGSTPENNFTKYIKNMKPIITAFDRNYRSTKVLVSSSQKYIYNSFEKEITDKYAIPVKIESRELGEKITLAEFDNVSDEAVWIYNEILKLHEVPLSKIAILSRNNSINKEIATIFKELNCEGKRKIEFLLIDEFKFFRRQEIKDIISCLKLTVNENDEISLKRIIKRFCSGIGDRTIEEIESKENKSLGIRLSDFININTYIYKDPYLLLLDALDKKNVVIFDVESTGINTSVDEIIQIGAIRIDKNGFEVDRFEVFVRPTKEVGSSASVHGFSDDFLKENGLEAKVALNLFLSYLGDSIIVGHNVTFDMDILLSQLIRLNIQNSKEIYFYDTLDISRRFYPKLENHKLATLSKYFTTKVSSDHNAMNDVIATGEILIKMVNEKIRPLIYQRSNTFQKYNGKFYEFAKEFNQFKNTTNNLSPSEIIKKAIEFLDIVNVYKDEEERLINIREFIEIAKSLEEKHLNFRDSLNEFLKITALSNSELERMIESHPRVPIITVHQSKGSEFEYVFIAGLQENVFPSYFSRTNEEINEEMRLFYVAITRAKKKLYLSYSRHNIHNKKAIRSRFITNIPSESINAYLY